MKVYIAFECSYDGTYVSRDAVKIFDVEVKARAWVEEIKATDWDWREYDEYEIE